MEIDTALWRLIAAFFLAALLYAPPCTPALAQEPSIIQEGEPAPHTGVLLRVEDAAQLLAELQLYRGLAQTRADALVELQAQCDADMAEITTAVTPVVPAPIPEPCECDELIWGLVGAGIGGVLVGGLALGLALGL